jgi:hypothetical protein
VHIPFCVVCGAWEVGTFTSSTIVCSTHCAAKLDIEEIVEHALDHVDSKVLDLLIDTIAKRVN